MRVLIGCEESGVGRRAFRALGHDAWSCDLVSARDGSPFHYQMDVMLALRLRRWDLMILHPSCRTMTVAGNKHYGRGKPKHHERVAEQEWSRRLWGEAREVCDHVALENPVSTIWAAIGEEAQYIQPWQFGHPEQKKTGLALYNLPRLIPTDNVFDEMMRLPKNQRERVFYMPPSETRSRDRSESYAGILAAMAAQWSAFLSLRVAA